ncbi:hypothetical protein ACH4E7_11795 [Kitasatospora sp. NPDC018058]|uniref:hypothetical protein n=1 Tax=Kitasatospora sp. NPDC018058 TaxID=3364025 RepID=UPI0037C09E7E
MRSWVTEVEFLLPGGQCKVRPDGVWQVPEIGVPVLMAEVDRSTMAPADVTAKSPRYRELFRTKDRDNDPVLADEEPADRAVHWWRRAYPGHARARYPPVALGVLCVVRSTGRSDGRRMVRPQNSGQILVSRMTRPWSRGTSPRACKHAPRRRRASRAVCRSAAPEG